MAGFQQSSRVWSLVRSLVAQDYVPPPARGAFSTTRRSAASFLSNSGRTVTESPTNGNFSAQSEGSFASVGAIAGVYVVEFTIDALSGTTASVGVANESTGDADGSGSYFGFGARSNILPFAAGDVIGVAFGVDHSSTPVYAVFKNGLHAADFDTGGLGNVSVAHFVAGSNPSGSGHFQVTAESRLDVMLYASNYAGYLPTSTLLDWPAVSPEADGFPPAAPAPGGGGTGVATFDPFRTPIGTLSSGNKIITSGATSGAKAMAVGQGTINTAVPGCVAEFTVGTVVPTSMYVGMVAGSANGNAGAAFFTDIKFNANGFYRISNSVTGTAAAWSAGDKIGLVLYGSGRAAFFRNGTTIGYGLMSNFDISSPYRFGVEAVSDGAAVSMRVECSVAAMTYGSAYAAFRDAAVNSGPPSFTPMGASGDWPSAGT